MCAPNTLQLGRANHTARSLLQPSGRDQQISPPTLASQSAEPPPTDSPAPFSKTVRRQHPTTCAPPQKPVGETGRATTTNRRRTYYSPPRHVLARPTSWAQKRSIHPDRKCGKLEERNTNSTPPCHTTAAGGHTTAFSRPPTEVRGVEQPPTQHRDRPPTHSGGPPTNTTWPPTPVRYRVSRAAPNAHERASQDSRGHTQPSISPPNTTAAGGHHTTQPHTRAPNAAHKQETMLPPTTRLHVSTQQQTPQHPVGPRRSSQHSSPANQRCGVGQHPIGTGRPLTNAVGPRITPSPRTTASSGRTQHPRRRTSHAGATHNTYTPQPRYTCGAPTKEHNTPQPAPAETIPAPHVRRAAPPNDPWPTATDTRTTTQTTSPADKPKKSFRQLRAKSHTTTVGGQPTTYPPCHHEQYPRRGQSGARPPTRRHQADTSPAVARRHRVAQRSHSYPTGTGGTNPRGVFATKPRKQHQGGQAARAPPREGTKP